MTPEDVEDYCHSLQTELDTMYAAAAIADCFSTQGYNAITTMHRSVVPFHSLQTELDKLRAIAAKYRAEQSHKSSVL
jgi:hypothetical protein